MESLFIFIVICLMVYLVFQRFQEKEDFDNRDN